jgi:hypothetical protein
MAELLGVPTHAVVRWLHLVAMAVLVGGAAMVWGSLRVGVGEMEGDGEGKKDGDRSGLAVAATYEWLFWGALGVIVLTGVGNLGALAPFVPGPSTGWGTVFAVKLAAVGGLLVGSLVRTLGVLRWRTPGPTDGDRLRRTYVATTLYLVALVGLAEVLAHG